MRASPFRKDVWEIMLTIPYGKTMTYGDIAKRIAEQKGIVRMAAQAVGGAVGHNSISLIIPCHRVVGADGSLTGYAGGIDKKVNLLRLEGALAEFAGRRVHHPLHIAREGRLGGEMHSVYNVGEREALVR